MNNKKVTKNIWYYVVAYVFIFSITGISIGPICLDKSTSIRNVGHIKLRIYEPDIRNVGHTKLRIYVTPDMRNVGHT